VAAAQTSPYAPEEFPLRSNVPLFHGSTQLTGFFESVFGFCKLDTKVKGLLSGVLYCNEGSSVVLRRGGAEDAV